MICKLHIVYISTEIYPKKLYISKFLRELKVSVQKQKSSKKEKSQIFGNPNK